MARFGLTVGEQEHKYLVFKEAKGLNTQPSREALKEDEQAWLENLMPIGDGFFKAVPNRGATILTSTVTLSQLHQAVLGTVNYEIVFTAAGGALALNLTASSTVTICAAGTFSTGYPALDQWKSERVVFTDPTNGMYSWDGTTFLSPGALVTVSVVAAGTGYTTTPSVTITGTATVTASATAILSGGGVSSISITNSGNGYAVPPAIGFSGGGGTGTTASAYIVPQGMNGQAIAVYSGRVWVFNNRVYSYTAPGSWYDVDTGHAAGSGVITEGSLKERVYAAEALDNYLYVFGDSSILVIGDVKVTASVTTFSITYLSSTTGTTLPFTITAMERAVLFTNREGVYALVGASLQKISKALDGIFPDINFDTTHAHPITGGLVTIYNIQCYAINFHYTGSRNGEANDRHIQALFLDGKWFITSQGDVEFLGPNSINGVQSMYAITDAGLAVRKLYNNTTASISTTFLSALSDLGNPIFDKQVIRAGVQITSSAAGAVTVEIDTETDFELQDLSAQLQPTWVNNSLQVVQWQNSSMNTVIWGTGGFNATDAPFDITGKYLGATFTSDEAGIILHGILMEYVYRASWSR